MIKLHRTRLRSSLGVEMVEHFMCILIEDQTIGTVSRNVTWIGTGRYQLSWYWSSGRGKLRRTCGRRINRMEEEELRKKGFSVRQNISSLPRVRETRRNEDRCDRQRRDGDYHSCRFWWCDCSRRRHRQKCVGRYGSFETEYGTKLTKKKNKLVDVKNLLLLKEQFPEHERTDRLRLRTTLTTLLYWSRSRMKVPFKTVRTRSRILKKSRPRRWRDQRGRSTVRETQIRDVKGNNQSSRLKLIIV